LGLALLVPTARLLGLALRVPTARAEAVEPVFGVARTGALDVARTDVPDATVES
jgi:hypothetical protein